MQKSALNPVIAAAPVKGVRKGPAICWQALISVSFCLLLLSCTRAQKLDLRRLKLPPGFHIAIFADAPNARQMAFSPGGVLLVTDMSDGTVLAFPDAKHTGHADRMVPVLSGLDLPHGIAFHKGKLYVAEIDAVRRYDWDESELRAGNAQKIVNFPTSGGGHIDPHHSFRQRQNVCRGGIELQRVH